MIWLITFINRPDEDDVGLFLSVGLGGVIEDIGLIDIDVTGELQVGSLVGENSGTVSNSYATGSVTGNGRVGGLVGWNRWGGTVSNSHAASSVTGEFEVGGLVGRNNRTVSNSYSTSSVTGESDVGGLVGYNWEGTVSNSYFTGSVTGWGSVGGLVGRNTGTVTNSHYDYDGVLTNGQNMITIGALLGEDFEEWLANDKFLDVNERLSQENGYYVIKNVSDFKELLAFGQDGSLKFRLTNDLDLRNEANFCIPYLAAEFDGNGHKILNLSFNCDFVSQAGLFGYLASGARVTKLGVENVRIVGHGSVGGLVGRNYYGTVSNSYATGSVTGIWDVGGLVGYNYDGTVSNSYAAGSVAGDKNVGGLVGAGSKGTIRCSFWDIETSGQSTSAGGMGRTTAEMRNIATFKAAEWSIIAVTAGVTNPSYIWNIIEGQTYPFLSWQSVS